jgi:adenylate cyclase
MGNQPMAFRSKEIERKFLLRELPQGIRAKDKQTLFQGYLAFGPKEAEVRIRRKGSSYWLTAKAGRGMVRREEEVRLTRQQFEQLWPLTQGRRLVKERRSYPHDGVVIEVDVYKGKQKGLQVAEVEFPTVRAARRFRPPLWLGREITGVTRFRNRNLAVD